MSEGTCLNILKDFRIWNAFRFRPDYRFHANAGIDSGLDFVDANQVCDLIINRMWAVQGSFLSPKCVVENPVSTNMY